ncbi:hypothetical protein [Brevundimonas sp. R86498]|uniref:hypothetical protein n=1 Tax=Brevundimonas sp. R86498 TaxID=3093845 RepID=UPI0037C5EADF
MDWRTTFERWATERFHRSGARIGLHKEFGPELVRIRNTFEDVCPFVIDSVRDFFSRNWQGFLLRRESYFCVSPTTARYITASQAARTLGIRMPRIWDFVEAGEVVAVQRSSGRRVYRAIRADGVEKLRRHLASLLTPVEAAMVMGISKVKLRMLDRAGLVAAEQIISHTKRYNTKVLHEFCTNLVNADRPITETSARLTELRTLPFLTLIQGIRDGRLAAWFGPDGTNSLANIYLDGAEIESLSRSDSQEKMMTARKATQQLAVGHKTLAVLVKAKGTAAVWRKGYLMAVSASEVQRWSSTITTAAKVADRLGIAPTSVTRRLKQLGIVPVLATAHAEKITALWLLSDVQAVDFSKQWLTGCGQPCRAPKAARLKKLVRRPSRSIPEGNISLTHLSKLLQIDKETLRHLAIAGFLEATELTRSGHLRGVTKTSAASFERKYVSSSELARLHGLNAVGVTRRLLSLGIKSILSPGAQSRVQMCWRRRDVRKIDFAAQYMLPCGRPSSPPRCVGAKLLEPRPLGSPRLLPGAMYVHTATGILGTNSFSLRAAVEAGYIRASTRSATDKILTVVEADVHAFSSCYIFTPKLASKLGLSIRSVNRNLARLDVKPIWPGERPIHALWEKSSYDEGQLLERWVTAAGVLSEQSSLFPDKL